MTVLTAELLVPAAILLASIADRTPLEAELTAPKPSVVSQMGAHVVLTAPAAAVQAQGTIRPVIHVDLIAPVAKVEVEASVGTTLYAGLNAPAAIVDAWGGSQIVVVAPAAAVGAHALGFGHAAQLELTAPVPRLNAEGFAPAAGFVAELLAPAGYLAPETVAVMTAPTPRVYALVQPPVVAEFEAYAVNMFTDLQYAKNEGGLEVTRYTNYPFTKIVRFGPHYYGVAADGLYRLEGEDDDGQPIRWALGTATMDFKTPARKTPVSCTLGGRIGVPVGFTVMTGEAREDSYQYSSTRKDTAQNHRQVFGRGLNSRYYTFLVEGDGPLDLDDMTFELHIKTRSI